MVNINPLSANFTKWSNTLKQFVSKLTKNCLSVFDHFVGLALKGLTLLNILKAIATSANVYRHIKTTSEVVLNGFLYESH